MLLISCAYAFGAERRVSSMLNPSNNFTIPSLSQPRLHARRSAGVVLALIALVVVAAGINASAQGTAKNAKAAPAAATAKSDIPEPIESVMCSSSTDSFERTRANIAEKTVYFVNLRDGDKVISPFRVVFGLTGMGIAPAGVKQENTGHHHLLIDKPLSTEMLTQPIPFGESYRHFGKGQTEAIVGLTPGKHKLRLLFADADHKPFYVYSNEITVEVVKSSEK